MRKLTAALAFLAFAAGASPKTGGEDTAAINWVLIPGGTFRMGSDSGWKDEKPVHKVKVASFEMARTEVTYRQYLACVKAGACTPLPPGCVPPSENHPVVCVDWDQATAFCKWAGGRLPTEAEWEYAATSRGKYAYPWGNEPPNCDKAVMDGDGGSGCGRRNTWPVCSKPKGNTEQGLCDMAGNAWEWVQDMYYRSYEGAPSDGSAWEGMGFSRVIRGVSFNSDAAAALRASYRDRSCPDAHRSNIGFRPARSRR